MPSTRPPKAIDRHLIGAAICLGLVAIPSGPAAAQSAPTSIAEQLFLEGRALMQAKQYQQACEKFKASYALDATAYGTLLNLALCHEATNKTASAWAEFRVVAAASAGRREDRVALAREHERALFPKLSYVKIVDPAVTRVPGLAIRIDKDVALDEAAWNTEISIDPGPHVIEASAPGKVARTHEVLVGDVAHHSTVTVDPLADTPRDVAASEASGGEDRSRHTRMVVSYVVAGTGVALAGAGLAFGLVASNKNDDAAALCPSDVCANEPDRLRASSTLADADRFATVANILVSTGAVLAVTGVVLALTAPSGSKATAKSSLAASATVLPGGSGFSLTGRF